MIVLDRAAVLAKLHAFRAGDVSSKGLADWAFDTFYAEAEGTVAYERGYRAVLARVLDDLMFGDDPHFQLNADDVERLVQRLEAAVYDDAESDEDERDDDGEGADSDG